MQRWKTILSNTSFGLNCMLVFLLIVEDKISLPAWVQVLGRMHTLLLHFPIVLLVCCVCWELFTGYKKSLTPEQKGIGDGLLLITTFTSVISALMGLLLSKEPGYIPEELSWHKWGGVFISLLAMAWYIFREQLRNKKMILSFTAVVSLVAVTITGHLGGNITHGDNFLFAPVTKDKQAPTVLFEDAIIYANMVQPILKAKCISCHNSSKAKGQLIMESFTQLLKGGKSGALWDVTKPDFGLMLGRIHLPMEQKKHMPPSGKTQLTDEEISILYYWIKMGANATAKVTSLPASDTLRSLATAMFKTIETDDYSFKAADESKVKSLSNNYRFITPLAMESPALGVEFFGATQFKSEQLNELLPLKEQIIALNLNKMPVTDEDLTTIAQFTNLRKLNLSFTNIKGSGLVALNQLKEMKQLSLSGTGVTATNLAVLAALPKLTHLYVWSTPAQLQSLAGVQKQLRQTQIETGFNGDTVKMKLTAPILENEEQILLQPVALKLKHYVKGVTMRYTTDGSEPDSINSPLYNANVMLNKNMTLKAKAFKPGWYSSDIAEKTFYKAGIKIDSIRLVKPAPDMPYKTFSPSILTDAQKGELNFRSGKWIGYRGIPMQAMLYFDTLKIIGSVTVSSLIDIGGYIMPPQQVEVWAGIDSAHLRLLKRFNPEQPVKESPGYMKGYELIFNPVKERYLKVVVTPVAKLPKWHRGKGDKGWAFVDEIFLN
jgi:uncharacterized membrane protein